MNEGRDHELFRADHVDSLALAWTAPRRLDARYAKARIFAFTNFWNSAAVRDFGYTVQHGWKSGSIQRVQASSGGELLAGSGV